MKHLLPHYKQFYALALPVLVATVLPNFSMMAADPLEEEMPAHQFFMKSGKSQLPVVGVKSENRIYIQKPDGTRGLMSPDPHELRIVEKSMLPVGRVTLCSTAARSEQQTRLEADVSAEITGDKMTREMGETVFDFEVIADRDLNECYVALFLYHIDSPDDVVVDFGSMGNLQAGQFASREIFFPNTAVTEGMEYRFEFYSAGSPLEMYRLVNVATNPASRSLMIPFDLRLQTYLASARKKKTSENPRPWKMGIPSLDLDGYRARGSKDLRIKVRVNADGSVELVESDTRLTDAEKSSLRNDISKWQFFPELEKGRPKSKLVTVPLKV